MNIFGKPNIEKLKQKSKVNTLIKAVSFRRDIEIRSSAIEALGDLNIQKAILPIQKNLLIEPDETVRRTSVKTLEKLGWEPEHNDKAAALFWYYKREYQKCASCGGYALELLFNQVIERNYDAVDAFIEMGQPALDFLISNTNAIFNYYKNFTAKIHALHFTSREDQIKAKQIEKYTDLLQNCAYAIGKFGMPLSENYLIYLYNMVKVSIYSTPEGDFYDLFYAVKVRKALVESLEYTYSTEGLSFLIGILENEPAHFVRWAAIDIIDKISNKSVADLKNDRIIQALNLALQKEKDTISNRKNKIKGIFEKINSSKR